MKCHSNRKVLSLVLTTTLVLLWLSRHFSYKGIFFNQNYSYGRDKMNNASIRRSIKEDLKECLSSGTCGRMRKPIVVNERARILYCPIPKVASTSVKLALVREIKSIVGRYSVHKVHEMERAGFERLHKFRGRLTLHSFEKLIVVRHPLERLLSAYLDKFKQKNKWTKYFQAKYGWQIISKYRKSGVSLGDEDVTFEEFVEFLTDETTPCESRMDPHWAPYWILCRVCWIKYDRVVRMENLTEGLNEFWFKVFRKPLNASLWSWEHRGLHSTRPLMESYFGALSPRLLSKLYELYRIDFELYGYEKRYRQK